MWEKFSKYKILMFKISQTQKNKKKIVPEQLFGSFDYFSLHQQSFRKHHQGYNSLLRKYTFGERGIQI